jgi:hypothetical protein
MLNRSSLAITFVVRRGGRSSSMEFTAKTPGGVRRRRRFLTGHYLQAVAFGGWLRALLSLSLTAFDAAPCVWL